uniref:ARF7EP_C domain-containing protein n=1 Tax=Anopheles atroparvus TaxID=41427 RepID=A0A182IMB6_ANOAO
MVEDYVDISSSSDEGADDADNARNQPANGTAEEKQGTANEPGPKRQRKGRSRAQLVDEQSKFLADFDPGSSQREKRKLARSIRQSMHEPPVKPCSSGMSSEKVTGRNGGKDLCDCLSESCAGCHFPCDGCGSGKCGHVCRKNRKWFYEEIYIDAKGDRTRNPLLDKPTKK